MAHPFGPRLAAPSREGSVFVLEAGATVPLHPGEEDQVFLLIPPEGMVACMLERTNKHVQLCLCTPDLRRRAGECGFSIHPRLN